MAKDKKGSATGVDRWRESQGGAAKPSKSSKAVKAGKASAAGKGKTKSRRRMPAAVKRHMGTLIFVVVLCVVCVIGFTPLGERITQGLDIQGGVSVILTATKSDGSTPTSDEMSTATTIVQSRVNALGASEATVQQQGTSSILVQIPGATDASSTVAAIGQTGHLEFVRLDDIGDAEALAKINAGTENVTLEAGTYTAFMDGSYVSSTSVEQSSSSVGTYVVNVTLNDEGAEIFSEVTGELASTNGQIAIVLDGVVNSAPAVQSQITGGKVSISGNFTSDEAQSLKTVLDSGSLPVTLTYSESRAVGPTLGQDSLVQGVTALAVGMVVVVIYLFVFYRGLGLLTLGSLGVFAVLYLGLLALLSHFGMFALSLSGLAGMVLTTGSAADSSILVLERFREEVRMGKTVKNASVSGSKHGIRTSLDADVVTLVTALALLFVATGDVRGFGLTLALGVLCDVVTMFCFKAPLLRLLALGAIQKAPRFWGISEDLAEAEKNGVSAVAREGAGKATKVTLVEKGGEADA
jgi:preprotein translocase subunit SecD